jgi:hypothetical protein
MADHVDDKSGNTVEQPGAAPKTSIQSSQDTKEKTLLEPDIVDTVIEGAVTKDGIKIHPQPTTDPLDPLNWSPWRKNGILAIVMAK